MQIRNGKTNQLMYVRNIFSYQVPILIGNSGNVDFCIRRCFQEHTCPVSAMSMLIMEGIQGDGMRRSILRIRKVARNSFSIYCSRHCWMGCVDPSIQDRNSNTLVLSVLLDGCMD